MVLLKGPFYAGTGSQVIAGGKSKEQQESDFAAGIGRVGGLWRNPSYFESYLLAAETLIQQGRQCKNYDDIALPAFYLQRHAVELLIKSVLGWLLDIQDLRAMVRDPGYTCDEEYRHEQLFGHGLSILMARVQALCVDLEFPAPPAPLTALVKQLTEVELTETFARYSTSRRRKKGAPTIAHLAEEQVIELEEIQRHLNEVAELAVERAFGRDSYEGELYTEWCRLDLILESR